MLVICNGGGIRVTGTTGVFTTGVFVTICTGGELVLVSASGGWSFVVVDVCVAVGISPPPAL